MSYIAVITKAVRINNFLFFHRIWIWMITHNIWLLWRNEKKCYHFWLENECPIQSSVLEKTNKQTNKKSFSKMRLRNVGHSGFELKV